MKNVICDFSTAIEQNFDMDSFQDYLNEEEEGLARKYFDTYVFFETLDKRTRRCVCTSCGGYCLEKEINPGYFDVKHNTKCECANCGQRATHLAMGKYRNFKSLNSHINAVLVRAYHDGLLIQAGWVERDFDDEDLCGMIDFTSLKRYYYSSDGKVAAWRRYYYSGIFGQKVSSDWIKMDTIREPFVNNMGSYDDTTTYAVLGYKNIVGTKYRYCMFAEWFDDAFGGMLGGGDFEDEPFYVKYLVKYLAEYTRRPQMEMLVKLDHMDVVKDLVIHRNQNGTILNWRAKDPASFFKLSKADYRSFKDAGISWKSLVAYRKMLKNGQVSSLKEYGAAKKNLGNEFEKVVLCAEMAGVSLKRAENYVNSFQGGCRHGYVPISRIATTWKDYLTAAVALRYDLKRDDVTMPKDLNERHDAATAAAHMKTSEKAVKKYVKSYAELVAQFSFVADGLMITVPPDIESIITEGRVLEHCVGGYANRHIEGKLVILFLRKTDAPEESYVTIELPEEQNCKKIEIKQIHGFRNERNGGRSPGERHKEFLSKWLDWIHQGSKRDQDGQPILDKPVEQQMKGDQVA